MTSEAQSVLRVFAQAEAKATQVVSDAIAAGDVQAGLGACPELLVS